jgi:hypothetical protein
MVEKLHACACVAGVNDRLSRQISADVNPDDYPDLRGLELCESSLGWSIPHNYHTSLFKICKSFAK